MINKKILAIDYGTKKIGLSLKKKGIYQPDPMTGIKNQGDVPFKILSICKKEEVDLVVIGLPFNTEGQETTMSQKIKNFGEILRGSLPKKIVIDYIDERHSTIRAKNLFRSTLKKQKSWIENKDSLAAMVILEKYLFEVYNK